MSFYCGELIVQGENDPREFAALLKKFDPLGVRVLTCSRCTFGQSAVSAISEMTYLHTIDLAMCTINECVLSNIMSLCLSGMSGMKEPRLPIRSIGLREVVTVDDSLFTTLALEGVCNTCTSMNVSSTRVVDLAVLAKVFPKLEKLRARFLTGVKGIKEVICTLPLTELSLEGIDDPALLESLPEAMKKRQREDSAPPITVRARGCSLDSRNVDMFVLNNKKTRAVHDLLGVGETSAVEKVDKLRVILCISFRKKIEVVLHDLVCNMTIKSIAHEAIEELNAMCSQKERKKKAVAAKARRRAYAEALGEFMGTSVEYTLGVYGVYHVCKQTGREQRVTDINIATAFIGLNRSHSRMLIRVEAEERVAAR